MSRRVDSTAPRHRRLTVVTRGREHGRVPEIRMSGQWLARAGFPAGSRLAVAVTPGQLVVTVTAPPEPMPARWVYEESDVPYCLQPKGRRRRTRRLG
jgi:hypothetical protein